MIMKMVKYEEGDGIYNTSVISATKSNYHRGMFLINQPLVLLLPGAAAAAVLKKRPPSVQSLLVS